MSKAMLDKSKPFAEVHGDPTSNVAFEQDGKQFDTLGHEVGSVEGYEPAEAEKEVEEGKGNLAHGQIPEFNKPIEEGGGGGGMTKSYPQTTTEGQKVIDDHGEKVDDKVDKKPAKK